MIYEIRTAPVGTRNYNKSVTIAANEFPSSFEGTAGYSIYPYPPTFPDWFKRNGNSVSNYDGKNTMGWFPVDIEVKGQDGNYDTEAARKTAVGFADWLHQRYGIDRDANQYFFSGRKGFHILVNARWFTGNPTFGFELGMCYKARRLLNLLLCDRTGESLEVMEARTLEAGTHYGFDYNIYKPAQLLSVPNSVHPESRLYKIRLSWDEISGKDAAWIKQLAANKRQSSVKSAELSVCQRHEELAKLWASALSATKNDFEREKYDHEREGFFAAPTQGSRNETLFKQACLLFEQPGLADSHVEDLIYNIAHASNMSASEPISDKEVATLLRSARKKVARKSPNQAKDAKEAASYDPTLSDAASLADEFVTYWTTERCDMTVGLPNFDEEFRGNYKGLLIPVIGPAGTKKSFWAQHVALLNMERGERVMYSNMEMSRVTLFSRVMDYLSADRYPLSADIRDLLERKDPASIEKAKKMLKIVSDTFSDKIIVNSDKSMTAEKYKKALQKTQEMYGKVGMLVVDGLSMMNRTNDEVADMDKHSKELKELAIEMDIFILMITHTNKGGNKFNTDHVGSIRSSQKIVDNSDAFVSLSCMIDMVESTADDIRELKGCGIIKTYAKRGTGEEFATTFRFDGVTKKFDYDPVEKYIDYKMMLAKDKKKIGW